MTVAERIDPDVARQAARRKGIGGSDTPKILGISNWGTALDVWGQKLNLMPKEPESERMRWGKALEPFIAQAYMERTGKRIIRPGFIRHKEHDWLFGSIDRMVQGEKRLVELKNAGWSREWGEEGTSAVPLEYFVQVQHYLAVTDYPVADCAVLIGGNNFRIYTIERDDELLADLIPFLQEFWNNHVLTGIPPAVDGSEACKRHLNARWAREEPGSVQIADAECARLAGELKEARDAAKHAITWQREIENELKVRMGALEKLVGDGWQITWRAKAGARFVNYESIADVLASRCGIRPAEWTQLVQSHTGARAPSRVFLPKWETGGYRDEQSNSSGD